MTWEECAHWRARQTGMTGMTLKSHLLRTTFIAGTIGIAFGLGSAQAQISTTGGVSPAPSAVLGGTSQHDGSVVVGAGSGGTLTINGAGTQLQIDEVVAPGPGAFDGARLHVGTDTGTGQVTVTNGGSITIDNVGSPGRIDGAGLAISNVPGTNGIATLAGQVDVTNGMIDIDTDDGTAFINVGRDGSGIFNATGSTIILNSGTGDAVFNLGGTSMSGVPIPGAQVGTATIDSSVVTINSDSAIGGSAVLNVGRNSLGTTSTLNLVNGTSVTLTNDDAPGSTSLSVGRGSSEGVMNIDASAVDVADFVSIGRDGGDGTMNVDNNALVDNNDGVGLTRVGRGGGTGELSVRSGSIFTTNNMQLGRDSGSVGTVNVSGSTTALLVGDTIQVGRDSNGTMNIGDDPDTVPVETSGLVAAHTMSVGFNAGANGTLNVNSSGSLNLNGIDPDGNGALLQIGRVGTGVVNVGANSSIDVNALGSPSNLPGGLLLGGSASDPTTSGDGTLNIDGGTVTLNTGGTTVGRQGTGVINITNGGRLVAEGGLVFPGQDRAVIARLAGSSGTVNVDGASSRWDVNDLFIGLDVDSSGTVNGTGGTGALNVTNNAFVDADGDITNGASGTINVSDNAALFANNIVNQSGGTIAGGGGTIFSNIDNAGTIGPGNSAGLMSVIGNVTMEAGSTMEIELGGTVFDTGIGTIEYDRLDVAGTGLGGGTFDVDSAAMFDVSFINGFVASLGDSFDIVIADDITGIFGEANFLLPALTAGLVWDGGVFDVAGRDVLRIFIAEADAAVPEPGAALILLAGLGGLLLVRRRRTL